MNTCPLCGTAKEHDIFIGAQAGEIGPKFWCGSIYSHSQQQVTKLGIACSTIQGLREQLESRNSRLSEGEEKK